MSLIYLFLCLMFVMRLVFLRLSIRNEKAILANGGREYGATVSKVITILHISFYLAVAIEIYLHQPAFDGTSLLGLSLMIFSLAILKVVTSLLGDIWTIKLMVVNDHQFVDHWLFKTIKHPNYYLNIMPELIGICLLGHAWVSAVIIIPFYAIALMFRIREENRLLAEVIIPNTRLK
ncbi:isoprenylcysteine carboxyl methyltransferase family protein [Streptococcus halotolerans]|uniref:isoprenylcysteine carboxyl methyltransferase family protein n=1 Tax=Streptococcus halotolerans TaxID=1814128 RepID=UPI000786E5B5|nr:isoprenylcysteine carboxyl methyltransferase family protein [Streptococcus halotolerans]